MILVHPEEQVSRGRQRLRYSGDETDDGLLAHQGWAICCAMMKVVAGYRLSRNF